MRRGLGDVVCGQASHGQKQMCAEPDIQYNIVKTEVKPECPLSLGKPRVICEA